MIDHDHDCTLHALLGQGKRAQHDETQVTDGAVRHQPLDVALRHREQCAVDDPDDREHQDRVAERRVGDCSRKERDREAQNRVGANLETERDCGERGRGALRIGEPGMERYQRGLHRKCGEEREEHEQLCAIAEREREQMIDMERLAPAEIPECHDGHEHEQRTDERKKHVAKTRTHSGTRSPDPDQKIHRDQHQLPRKIEEQQIERHKNADQP